MVYVQKFNVLGMTQQVLISIIRLLWMWLRNYTSAVETANVMYIVQTALLVGVVAAVKLRDCKVRTKYYNGVRESSAKAFAS